MPRETSQQPVGSGPDRVTIKDPSPGRSNAGLLLFVFAYAAIMLGIMALRPSRAVLGGLAVVILILGGGLTQLLTRPRKIEVRRAGDLVLGLKAGPLPVGDARLVVDTRLLDTQDYLNNPAVRKASCHLRFERHGQSVALFESYDFAAIRAATMALCRLGRWQMVWYGPPGHEVLGPDELDRPPGAG